MSGPNVLEIGVDAAIGNCVEYLRSVALEDAAQQMEAVRAAVDELIELSHVIDAEFRSDPMAVQCFDLGVLKRWQDALARIGGAK